MTAGTLTGTLGGTYTELNLRNNSTGDTVFGNNVQVIGSGFTNINPIGTVTTDGIVSTMGNLMIGGGQTLGVNRNGTPTLTAAFQSVTLTGGKATFSPGTFGSGWSGTGSLVLGAIGENTPGSGIIMDGQSTLTLKGVNSYTGSMTINSGTVVDTLADQFAHTSNLVMNGGTLNANNFNEQMGAIGLTSSSIIDFGSNGSNTNTLRFANSSGLVWTSGMQLSIYNWTPNPSGAGLGGGPTPIFVGNSASGSPPSGLSIAQLNAIAFSGYSPGAVILSNGELVPGTPPALLMIGDLTGDGQVTGADLSKLEQALTNLNGYEVEKGYTYGDVLSVADVNHDGAFDNADVQAEIYYLIHGVLPGPSPGGAAPVPEPSAIILLALGGVAVWMRRRAS
jgi:autotransporter-associated beta strand protein